MFLHYAAAREFEYYGPFLTDAAENGSVVIRCHRTITGITMCRFDEKAGTRGAVISKMSLEKTQKGEGGSLERARCLLGPIYDGIWDVDSRQKPGIRIDRGAVRRRLSLGPG